MAKETPAAPQDDEGGREGVDHDAAAEEHIGDAGPVDAAAADQELLVDRLEQEEVEVAGADELGELIAVLEEERFHDAAHGVVAADEKEVLVFLPVGDRLGL